MIKFIKNLYKGRISRANYNRGLIWTTFFWIVITLIFVPIFYKIPILGKIVIGSWYAIIFLYLQFLTIRRFHDLGKRGKSYFYSFIDSIFLGEIFYKKGQPDANEFGEKPPDNIRVIDALFNLKPRNPLRSDIKSKKENL